MLELYIPKVEDMWFVRQMQEDPATMAYNAGWDVSYDGYHPDTGCIDFPESEWADKHDYLVNHEPERFYAFVRRKSDSTFVGEVNFHYTPEQDWWDMGVLIHSTFRGNGYGHLALALLLQKAFVDCGVTRLHNDFETTRDAGVAIHLAAGFRPCGTSRAVRFGKPIELQEVMLTKEQYIANHAKLRMVNDPLEKEQIAASVLADLPDWFGLPDSTANYVTQSKTMPFWTAEYQNESIGFAALKETGPRTAEIYVMGVRPQYHCFGVGKRLLSELRDYAREHGYRFLQVKTVQTGHYAEYDRTNAFYQAMGFEELECFPDLWDPWNPCQVYIMQI